MPIYGMFLLVVFTTMAVLKTAPNKLKISKIRDNFSMLVL